MQRLEIQKHIEDFLAKGGTITQLPQNASRYADEPIKLSRKDQVEKMRSGRARG